MGVPDITGGPRNQRDFLARQQEVQQRRAAFAEEKELLPTDTARLQLLRGQEEFKEFQAGAGQRAAERGLGEAQAQIGLAAIGDVQQAGQRAYTLGRETEELERLRMASQGQRFQSQMAFQPQMDALRGGIMGRMAGRLGVQLPQMGQSYESGTNVGLRRSERYTPSWMQSYQPPQFPRY